MSKKVTIPLRNYKDRRGGRVTPGTYRAKVMDVELGKSAGGDDMITMYFTIIGGEFDGTTIIDRLFPSMEKAQWRTVAYLQAAGIPTPRKDFVLDLDAFKNRPMDITVEDGKPYNGSVRSEVRGYAKVSASASQSDADVEDVEDEDDSAAAPAPAPSADSPEDAVADPELDELDLDELDEV